MQNIGGDYSEIIAAGDYEVETKLIIGGFEYDEDRIFTASVSRSLFNGNEPTVGACVSAELDCVIEAQSSDVPKASKIEPFVRVRKNINGVEKTSPWIRKGIYFADTRDANLRQGTLTIHAFDAMLATEAKYDATESLSVANAVNHILGTISTALGETVELDPETTFGFSFDIPVPSSPTSMRTVLGNIAAAFAGNWIITDTGKLRLIKLNTLPTETFYLVSRDNDTITYGGDRIVLL